MGMKTNLRSKKDGEMIKRELEGFINAVKDGFEEVKIQTSEYDVRIEGLEREITKINEKLDSLFASFEKWEN